jgi:ferritin-like metal-binding protein YciE
MFGKIKVKNLRDLYLHELKDAYDFEHQILEALPKMEQSANATELKNAFRHHRTQTEGQVRRLEQIFRDMGETPSRSTCKAMKGIIGEGEAFLKARGDNDTLDAALISAAQRVEHYEMAVYGTLRAYANVLGHRQQAALLQQTLDEEAETDRSLTQLAQSGINLEAAT